MASSPTIQVFVPGPLREQSGGASQLSLAAQNVGGALLELARAYPALHRCVCDDTGAVRRHVNLFVNREHIRDLAGLETKLAPGDVLTIMPAVSGG